MFISESDGFSINTDIFETNILNLAVVIGILIYYGRSVVSDLLKSRKDAISKSLQEADNKLREAEEILLVAKKNLEMAKSKSDEIRTQGNIISDQTSTSLLKNIEEDIKRLNLANVSSIKFEEEKSISEICHKLGSSALLKTIEILNGTLNPNIQKKFVSRNIDKLSLKF